MQVVYCSPSNCTLGLGPPHSWNGAWVKLLRAFYAGGMMNMNNPCCSLTWWGPDQAEPPREGAALYCISPVPCAFSCELAYEPAQPSHAFSRQVSGRRSGA